MTTDHDGRRAPRPARPGRALSGRLFGAGAVVAGLFGALGCGEAAEQAEGELYETAVETALASQGITGEQGDCVADAFVDTVSVDRLSDAVSVDDLNAENGVDLRDLDIDLDPSVAGDFVGAMDDCLEVSDFFAETIARQEDLVGEQVDCVRDLVSADTVETYLTASFLGAFTGQEPSDVVADEVTTCTSGG